MRFLVLSFLLIIKFNPASAQVYRVNAPASLLISAASTSLGVYGLSLMDNRSSTDSLTVLRMQDQNQEYLSKIDVKSTTADKVSDACLASGIIMPAALLAFSKGRSEIGSIGLMYLETMTITGMSYALSGGLVKKYRPYAYSPEVDLKRRMSHRATYSFFAGHVAMTAAGSFFTAKVISDLYPESGFKYLAWGAASATTAACAYYRYYKGYHFPGDIAIGIGVGVLTGIGIPAIHKVKSDKLTVVPLLGPSQGIALTYKL